LDSLPDRCKLTLQKYPHQHGGNVNVVVMGMSPSFKAAVSQALIAQLSLLTDFIFVAIFIGHWIERGLTYKRSFTITIERNVKECDMFFIDRMKNYRTIKIGI